MHEGALYVKRRGHAPHSSAGQLASEVGYAQIGPKAGDFLHIRV